MRNGVVAGVGFMGAASISRSAALTRVQAPRRNVNQLQRQAIVRPSFAVNPILQALASGTQGVWVDCTDVSQMVSGRTGDTPAVINGPVGQLFDKSGRAHRFTQLSDAHRPVFSARINVLEGTSALVTQTVATVESDYVLRFTGDGTVTLSGTASGTYAEGTHVVTVIAGSLTLTVAGTVTDADLRLSMDTQHGWPEYQAVNTDTDYDVDGFPRFLQFDGVDDKLLSGVVQFDRSESATFFYAADCFTPSGRMAELSFNVGNNVNSFGSRLDENGYDIRVFTSTTSAFGLGTSIFMSGTVPTPNTDVVTGRITPGYLGVATRDIRRNKEQLAFSNTVPFGPIEWRNDFTQTGGGSVGGPFLRGRLYHMVILGEVVSDETCLAIESFLATARHGVYL
jgi:hypothetical protein